MFIKKLIFKKWQLFLMVIILSILFTGCSLNNKGKKVAVVDDTDIKKMMQLNRLAEKIYADVNHNKIEEARKGIIDLSEQAINISFHTVTTPEGVSTLMETIVSAKQTFSAVQYSTIEGVIVAAKLRLATDALTHKKEPMWLYYYKILREDGNQLRYAIEDNDKIQITRNLDQIMKHYDVIRPAVMISRQPSEVRKVDSFLLYLNREPNVSNMEQFDVILNELFERKAATVYMEMSYPQNPFFITFVMASIIISILSFVGWRRYKYDKGL